MKKKSPMFFVVWALVALLIVLHQDFWFWRDGTLVFGFIPVGLFYHACLSIAASLTWLLATLFAWPAEIEEKTLDEVKQVEMGDKP